MDYLLESIGLKKSKAGPLGLLAEFSDPDELLHAAQALRDRGYRKFDCHTPYPVHGLDDAMGLPGSKLGIIVFACGCVGLLAGIGLEGWTSSIAYPLVISNKPFFSLPAFIPVAFETTILFSALGAVFGMFAINQLPRFHHPVFYSDYFTKASDNGFFVSIEATDPLFDPQTAKTLLESLGGTNLELLEKND